MTEIQKISLKILSDASPALNLDPLLSIFARWRSETSHPAKWVDLADYAHMQHGAGIVLIGNVCNFSFDMGGPAPGILYVRKKGLSGCIKERLRTSLRDSFQLSERLLGEQEFPAGVRLKWGELELAFNDRLETPNTAETDRGLRPAVSAVLDDLFGPGQYSLQRYSDPARVYGFAVRATAAPQLGSLMEHLPA
jgi:hypothetical protein